MLEDLSTQFIGVSLEPFHISGWLVCHRSFLTLSTFPCIALRTSPDEGQEQSSDGPLLSCSRPRFDPKNCTVQITYCISFLITFVRFTKIYCKVTHCTNKVMSYKNKVTRYVKCTQPSGNGCTWLWPRLHLMFDKSRR